MSNLEKAQDQLGKYRTPFTKDSIEEAREKVMARTIFSEEKSVQISGFNFRKLYAAAAALVMILSLPFAIYLIGKTTISAEEKIVTHNFPDGSEAIIAKGSSISYNSILWRVTRSTKLRGEAFFKVQSGDQFTVETDHGGVNVLGTQFSVWDKADALVVQCREGKVDVEGKILQGDEYIIQYSDHSVRGQWSNNQHFISKDRRDLSFENTPIQIVIENLKERFGKDIRFASEDVYRFSGKLNADDLDISLKILTKPFGLKISYDKGVVVILEP